MRSHTAQDSAAVMAPARLLSYALHKTWQLLLLGVSGCDRLGKQYWEAEANNNLFNV